MELSSLAAIAAANAVADLTDAGAGTQTLVVYAGTKPASADTALTDQVALITFNLPEPAFAEAADDGTQAKAVLNAVAPVEAAATGTASFFRIINGNGAVLIQGTCSGTSGSGDVKLNSTAIQAGVQSTVISFSFSQPK